MFLFQYLCLNKQNDSKKDTISMFIFISSAFFISFTPSFIFLKTPLSCMAPGYLKRIPEIKL